MFYRVVLCAAVAAAQSGVTDPCASVRCPQACEVDAAGQAVCVSANSTGNNTACVQCFAAPCQVAQCDAGLVCEADDCACTHKCVKPAPMNTTAPTVHPCATLRCSMGCEVDAAGNAYCVQPTQNDTKPPTPTDKPACVQCFAAPCQVAQCDAGLVCEADDCTCTHKCVKPAPMNTTAPTVHPCATLRCSMGCEVDAAGNAYCVQPSKNDTKPPTPTDKPACVQCFAAPCQVAQCDAGLVCEADDCTCTHKCVKPAPMNTTAPTVHPCATLRCSMGCEVDAAGNAYCVQPSKNDTKPPTPTDKPCVQCFAAPCQVAQCDAGLVCEADDCTCTHKCVKPAPMNTTAPTVHPCATLRCSMGCEVDAAGNAYCVKPSKNDTKPPTPTDKPACVQCFAAPCQVAQCDAGLVCEADDCTCTHKCVKPAPMNTTAPTVHPCATLRCSMGCEVDAAGNAYCVQPSKNDTKPPTPATCTPYNESKMCIALAGWCYNPAKCECGDFGPLSDCDACKTAKCEDNYKCVSSGCGGCSHQCVKEDIPKPTDLPAKECETASGELVKDGASVRMDCNTCTCSNGMLRCTKMACPAPTDKPTDKPACVQCFAAPCQVAQCDAGLVCEADDCTCTHKCVKPAPMNTTAPTVHPCATLRCSMGCEVDAAGNAYCVKPSKNDTKPPTPTDKPTDKPACVQCFAAPCQVAQCDAGLVCEADDCACTHKCVKPAQNDTKPPVASGCTTDADCGASEWCRTARLPTMNSYLECADFAVRECVKRVGVGASCNGFTLPCATDRCEEGLECPCADPTCDLPGKCQKPTDKPTPVQNTTAPAPCLQVRCKENPCNLADCAPGFTCKENYCGGCNFECVKEDIPKPTDLPAKECETASGELVKDGASVRMDCNTCTCSNGMLRCTKMACPAPTDKPTDKPACVQCFAAPCQVAQCDAGLVCEADDCTCTHKCVKPAPMNTTAPTVHPCATLRCSMGCEVDAAGNAYCVKPSKNDTKPPTPTDKPACPQCFVAPCQVAKCDAGLVCQADDCACSHKCVKPAQNDTKPPVDGENCKTSTGMIKHGTSGKVDCNTCRCFDGKLACTKMYCPPTKEKSCKMDNGKMLKHNESTAVDCNTCTCMDGDLMCTEMACVKSCTLENGEVVKEGERFKKDCNTCWCNGGKVGCTEMACGAPTNYTCDEVRTLAPWTHEQRLWCCENKKQGCTVVQDKREKCMAAEKSGATVDAAFKADCCNSSNVMCPEPKFADCSAPKDDEREWCCRVMQKGCTMTCDAQKMDLVQATYCCNTFGSKCTDDYKNEQKTLDKQELKKAAKKVWKQIKQDVKGAIEDIFENPKAVLRRIRMTLFRGSATLAQNPQNLVVTLIAAYTKDGQMPPTDVADQWRVDIPHSWNEENHAEEHAVVADKSWSTSGASDARAAVVLQSGDSDQKYYFEYRVEGTDEQVGQSVAEMEESVGSGKLADNSGGMTVPVGSTMPIAVTGASDKPEESSESSDSGMGWLFAVIGSLGALCMGGLVAFVIFQRKQRQQNENELFIGQLEELTASLPDPEVAQTGSV